MALLNNFQVFHRPGMLLFLFISLSKLTNANTSFSSTSVGCVLNGDDDVYGIGIRMSLYLQWAALLIATWVAPDEARYARSIANIITIAVLANTFKNPQGGSVIVLEWWIVTFNTFFLQIGNVPFSRKLIGGSASSLGAMMLIWTAIVIANCWVWFAGMNLGRVEGCDVKTYFFFHAVSVYSGTWQTVFRTIAAVGCVFGAFFALTAIAAISWNVTNAVGKEDEDTAKQPLLAATLSTAFQILIGAIAIIETEMTIRINDINMAESLRSSGQLIPFAIGLFSFIATISVGVRNFIIGAPNLPFQLR
jgi:hypothetical protein